MLSKNRSDYITPDVRYFKALIIKDYKTPPIGGIKKEFTMNEKLKRIEICNNLIKEISKRERRFFYSQSKDRTAYFKMNGKRLSYIDEYTGKDVNVYKPDSYNFNGGGTCWQLMKEMKDFILTGNKRKKSGLYYIEDMKNQKGNVCYYGWGYSETAAKEIREIAYKIGYLIRPEG